MDNIAPRIDRLLLSGGLDSLCLRKEVTNILRDADYDPFPWQRCSWPLMISRLYEFNQDLSTPRKLRMFPVDYSLDWEKVRTREEYIEIDEQIDEFRDSVMAYNFMRRYRSLPPRNGNRKALLIMNYRHAFLQHIHHVEGDVRYNCAKYIHDVYGDRVSSVLINTLGYADDAGRQDAVQDGLWDAAFELAARTDVGFDITDTLFGEAPCDLPHPGWRSDGYRYRDLFTGMVFYLPIEQHVMVNGWEGTLTEDFKEEFLRRSAIGTDRDIKHLSDTFSEIMEYYEIEIYEHDDLPAKRAQIDKWKQ